MERLTFESDGYFAVRGKNCYEDQNEDYCGPAIERLAAYEGTGLAPADVADLMGNHAMAICKLAMVPKWIPVTERLPRNYQTVIIYDGDVDVALYCYDRFEEIGGQVPDRIDGVTHWQPLPDAPGKDGI